MSLKDEIKTYNGRIDSNIRALVRIKTEIYDYIDPDEIKVDITDELYELVSTLDEAVDQFIDLVNSLRDESEL